MRQTGLMYLMVIVLAGFSQGYIRGSLVVPEDAVATSLNIVGEEGLFRLGLVLDLTAFLLDAIISIWLYRLFRSYGQTLALTAAVLRLLAHPAIGSLNLLNHYLALQAALVPDLLTGFDANQLQSMSLLFMEGVPDLRRVFWVALPAIGAVAAPVTVARSAGYLDDTGWNRVRNGIVWRFSLSRKRGMAGPPGGDYGGPGRGKPYWLFFEKGVVYQ